MYICMYLFTALSKPIKREKHFLAKSGGKEKDWLWEQRYFYLARGSREEWRPIIERIPCVQETPMICMPSPVAGSGCEKTVVCHHLGSSLDRRFWLQVWCSGPFESSSSLFFPDISIHGDTRKPRQRVRGISLSYSFFLGDRNQPWIEEPWESEEETPSHWPAALRVTFRDSSDYPGPCLDTAPQTP